MLLRGSLAMDGNGPLVAAAGSHDHVAVLLQDDIGAVVEVEHRDGVELRWRAAGLGHRLRVNEVNLRNETKRAQLSDR